MNEMKVLSESEEMQVSGGVPFAPIILGIACRFAVSAVGGYEAGRLTAKIVHMIRSR